MAAASILARFAGRSWKNFGRFAKAATPALKSTPKYITKTAQETGKLRSYGSGIVTRLPRLHPTAATIAVNTALLAGTIGIAAPYIGGSIRQGLGIPTEDEKLKLSAEAYENVINANNAQLDYLQEREDWLDEEAIEGIGGGEGNVYRGLHTDQGGIFDPTSDLRAYGLQQNPQPGLAGLGDDLSGLVMPVLLIGGGVLALYAISKAV